MGSGPTSPSANTVSFVQFGVAQERPLAGGIPVDDFLAELESDPVVAEEFAAARRLAVSQMDIDPESFRALRLQAGLSQALLAANSETTQAHIANIEAARVDPGTDMIVRIARAMNVLPAVVFNAVLKDRNP